MTRKEAVFSTMKTHRWVPGYALTLPEVGGSEGLRRLRELRAEGYPIKQRKMKDSQAFEYRMEKTTKSG